MNTLLRYEKALGLSFKESIESLHWKENLSILAISKMAGVSRDWIYSTAKQLNLTLKDSKQAAIDRATHHKHPNIGKTKANNEWARRTSERMKKNNPMKIKSVALKRAEVMKDIFSKNLWPQEKKFKSILDRNKVKYEMQTPIGRYNIDFFLPDLNLCIEIDSTYKWGKERRNAAAKKDNFLIKSGYKILRINKVKLSDLSFINDILKANNVI